MTLSDVAKSSIGLAFSLGIIFAVGAATWRYVILPYRTPPARPTFANDIKSPPPPRPPILAIKASTEPKVKFTPKAVPEAKYQGKVNASSGLVLRAEPAQDSARIGGVDYNSTAYVLRESPDKEWVYIRQDGTKEEGWVRSGNLTRN